MRIPQELIDKANSVDLPSFLRSQGEEVRQEGRNYRWGRHDSVMLQGNKWVQNSTKKSGYSIAFTEQFYNLSFRDAVFFLLGSEAVPSLPDNGHREKGLFRLPERDSTNDTVIRYLTGRGVSLDVVSHFIETGTLYQQAGRFHNAVFVGRDPAGTPRYAFVRGVHDWTDREGELHKFRHEPSGSDKRFSFASPGTNSQLLCFESCIDVLSFMTLFPESRSSHLLSLAGTGQESLVQYVADHADIGSVFFCLDSDQAGRDASVRLAGILPESLKIGRLVPALKDWNELLQHSETVSKLYTMERRNNYGSGY